MRLYDLFKALRIEDTLADFLDEPEVQQLLEKEVVVKTDRQLLPNAAYDFEVKNDVDVEIQVRGRHAGR